MKLTPVVLLLPVLLISLHRSMPALCQGAVFIVVWILSICLNLGWGVYVSRQRRFQGCLCVAVGLIQILLLLMPVQAARV
jgi:hypothetical protein